MTTAGIEEAFSYVIAKPWRPDEPMTHDNFCTYTYGSQILNGTMTDAEAMLDYVKRHSNGGEGEWAIYRISYERLEPETVSSGD